MIGSHCTEYYEYGNKYFEFKSTITIRDLKEYTSCEPVYTLVIPREQQWCQRVFPRTMLVFSRIHKGCVLQCVSLDKLSGVTVVVEVRQSIGSIRTDFNFIQFTAWINNTKCLPVEHFVNFKSYKRKFSQSSEIVVTTIYFTIYELSLRFHL